MFRRFYTLFEYYKSLYGFSLYLVWLACARIGAIHSEVFAGFSEGALRLRNEDAKAKVVITASYNKRRGKKIDLIATDQRAIDG